MTLVILRHAIHFGLHLLAPAAIAKIWDSRHWKKAWFILVMTNLVDLDHLLSEPIFDPHRLSIGNHLLHSYPAITLYCLLLIPGKSRLIAIGLLWHMLTDGIDYFFLKLING